MEIIPLIYLKKRKIVSGKEKEHLTIDELGKIIGKDSKIYVLDLDGIDKYKPNLCLYPKLSEKYELWVDAGPRALGDIVDSIMAGATKITVRKNIWPELSIPAIKEITECGTYAHIDNKNQNIRSINLSFLNDVDGLVSLTNKNRMDADFKYTSFLKDMCTKYNVYTYDSKQKNYYYWKNFGVAGLFVDMIKTMEFKINEF